MKTWSDIYHKHIRLGADSGYAAFAADEYERRNSTMVSALEQHFEKTIEGLFLPRANDELASTSTTNEPPSLTFEQLQKTIELMLPRIPSLRIVESIYCTVMHTRWIGGGKTWRKESLSLHRIAIALTFGLIATALPSIPLLIVALVLMLQKRGWYETQKRTQICETVPNPALYKVAEPGGDVLVGHPVTVAQFRQEMMEEIDVAGLDTNS